jgi:hypothetical protein
LGGQGVRLSQPLRERRGFRARVDVHVVGAGHRDLEPVAAEGHHARGVTVFIHGASAHHALAGTTDDRRVCADPSAQAREKLRLIVVHGEVGEHQLWSGRQARGDFRAGGPPRLERVALPRQYGFCDEFHAASPAA